MNIDFGNAVAIDGQVGIVYQRKGPGTGDYGDLAHKPKINDIIVEGDKEGKDYNLQDKLIEGIGIELVDNGDHTVTINVIGGAGGGELQEDLIVSNPIGKYSKDETIPKGTEFEMIFRGLLSKTYYPTLTPPSLSIAYASQTLMKVGAMVASLKATLNFNRGNINPQYSSESPYRAGEATGYGVLLTGASISYSDSGTGNSFDIPSFTREMPGNVILSATASYAEGVQPKDSDGGDYQGPLPAGQVSANKTIEFILPFFWGKSSLASLATLDGLTEDLVKKGQRNYTYENAADEYLYIAYDAAYGNLAHITDELNYENIDVWQRSELIFEGHNYIVYRSAFAITGSPAFTFKF